jgi:biopolymer transport protein ExbD
MRFKGRMELEQGLKQVDIAPIINIVFLLLIFVLLFSSFMTYSGLKVNLPKAITSEAVKKENIEIIITNENKIYLDGQLTEMPALRSFLKEAGKRGQTIFIKSDKRASLGAVVEIWDLARELGLSGINIATDQE